jgi:protein translocase SecG subunit
MEVVLVTLQIIVSISLITLVVIQGKGGGLGSSFGSTAMFSKRRGVEQFVFYLTIAAAIAFFLISVTNLVV